MRPYWFRPRRFWGVFAAYYPVRWQGWLVVFACAGALLASFLWADIGSHSISDTLLRFVPWAIIVGLIFDLISLRTGEYPSWWRRFGHFGDRS